jgi:hypothetical protein
MWKNLWFQKLCPNCSRYSPPIWFFNKKLYGVWVFLVVVPWNLEISRRFGGPYRLHLKGRKLNQACCLPLLGSSTLALRAVGDNEKATQCLGIQPSRPVPRGYKYEDLALQVEGGSNLWNSAVEILPLQWTHMQQLKNCWTLRFLCCSFCINENRWSVLPELPFVQFMFLVYTSWQNNGGRISENRILYTLY